jgi:hypothetical protein
MDSVTILDTVYTCETYDSIKFIPNSDIVNHFFWRVVEKAYPNNIEDTLYADTIYLPGNFEGQVNYQGSDGINYYGSAIDIKPLTLFALDKSGSCGSLVQLNVIPNYSGSGYTNYSWTPTEGLSDPAISNPTTLITDNKEYTVTAVVPNGCIVSKNVHVTLQAMDSPSICIVGVDSINKNILYWEKPLSSAIDSVFIYKETNVTNVYKKIGAVSNHDNAYYIDTASFPMIQSNKYKISVKDTCEIESDKSLPHKTIHLAINQGLNNSWNLIWEPYEGFTVSTYYIYRGTNSKDLQMIGSMAGSSTQYTDFAAPSGFLFYQIEVINPTPCSFSDLKSTQISVISSRSNIATNSLTGFGEIENKSNLYSVYPNPFGDKLVIELRQGEFNKGLLEITDLTGKEIKSVDLRSAKSEINCSDLKKGLYILKIKADKETFTQKIIKN